MVTGDPDGDISRHILLKRDHSGGFKIPPVFARPDLTRFFGVKQPDRQLGTGRVAADIAVNEKIAVNFRAGRSAIRVVSGRR